MKRNSKKATVVLLCTLMVALLIYQGGALLQLTCYAAKHSASLLLFNGIATKPNTSVFTPVDTEASLPSQPSQPSIETDTVPPATPPKGVETGEVKTTVLSLSAANTKSGGVHVSNKTDRTIDLDDYLDQGLPFTMTETGQPQVLIVHTHGSEAFAEGDYGYYVKSASTRSTDNSKNMVAVGQVIADKLNEAGIVTINDPTLHDHPNYTGSYTRSAETIQKYLEQYPSIKVVIDAHRDAISGSGDQKIKPTVEIMGQKAAQIMILAGCESGSVTDFPNWEENFRFCLQLQKKIEADYPGLARPLSFKACKYNFDMLSGSILIEIGSDTNTLAEAKYSAQLLSQALIKVLQP